jgi:hypothetical protein
MSSITSFGTLSPFSEYQSTATFTTRTQIAVQNHASLEAMPPSVISLAEQQVPRQVVVQTPAMTLEPIPHAIQILPTTEDTQIGRLGRSRSSQGHSSGRDLE